MGTGGLLTVESEYSENTGICPPQIHPGCKGLNWGLRGGKPVSMRLKNRYISPERVKKYLKRYTVEGRQDKETRQGQDFRAEHIKPTFVLPDRSIILLLPLFYFP
jgi:hypothetical protein